MHAVQRVARSRREQRAIIEARLERLRRLRILPAAQHEDTYNAICRNADLPTAMADEDVTWRLYMKQLRLGRTLRAIHRRSRAAWRALDALTHCRQCNTWLLDDYIELGVCGACLDAEAEEMGAGPAVVAGYGDRW